MALTKTLTATIDKDSGNYAGLDEEILLLDKNVYTINLTINEGANSLDVTGFTVSLLLGGTDIPLTHTNSAAGEVSLVIADTGLLFPSTGLQRLTLKIVDGITEAHFKGLSFYTSTL